MEPIILPRISDQKPLVSVVSITYNHEPYIRDCLEGFLMQKTTFPMEIIVHDDASTDHTADILREYYEKRPDLFHVIIERENQYSQHKSIAAPLYEMAQGKYIAICEGDDYWTDPLKLQKQFDFMEANGEYSCCFHNAFLLNAGTGTKTEYYKKQLKKNWTLNDVIKGGGGLMPTASMLFRAEYMKDFGEFRAGCPVGDYSLAIHLANKGLTHYDQDIMSVYRISVPGSWSTRNSDSQKAQRMTRQMLEWLEKIEKTIDAKEAIDYIKGFYLTRQYDRDQEYKKLLNDELAMNFVRKSNLLARLKYFIKTRCPILIKTYRKLK